MRKILGLYNGNTVDNTTSKQRSNSISSTNNVTSQQDNTTPISDNDLLSNPFFQTLKPLN